MTRADAEALVRSVERRCRGPLPAEAREVITRLLHDGKEREASALDANLRRGCGADFNEVIIAHPFDGQERAVACPACGLAISYKAPRFEGLEE